MLPVAEQLWWPALAAAATFAAIASWRGGGQRWLAAAPGSPPPAGSGRARISGRRAAGITVLAASPLLLLTGATWWALLMVGLLAGCAWWLAARSGAAEATRRQAALAGALPQVCDLLSVCLEAGLPLPRAVELLVPLLPGPAGDVLGRVLAELRLGVDEGSAWGGLAAAEPAWAALGRQVGRSAGSGVALARRLRELGQAATRDAESAAQVRARKVGVQSVLPLMLCFLPAFLLLGVVPIIGGVIQRLF